MNEESCIIHAPESLFVAVRQDYVGICKARQMRHPLCAAALLNMFERWHNVKLATFNQSLAKYHAAKAANRYCEVKADMWIFMSNPAMKEEMQGLFGETVIRHSVQDLENAGFIKSRHNPKDTRDRTLQYLFFHLRVQNALYEWASSTNAPSRIFTASKRYKYGMQSAETQDAPRRKTGTLPQSLPQTPPQKQPQKQKRISPQGETPVQPSAFEEFVEDELFEDDEPEEKPQQKENPRPDLTRQQILVGAAMQAFGIGGAFAAKLVKQLTGTEEKGKRAEWNIEPAMRPIDIAAFGIWYGSTYENKPPTTAETLYERVLEFRGIEEVNPQDWADYLMRGGLALDNYFLPKSKQPEPEEEITPEEQAEIDALYENLGALAKKFENG